MGDPTVRVLRLLSLLQRRSVWTGDALSDALGAPPRTVRRDVAKLRELGYPVESERGVGGGYRLGVGGRMPPLVLDDEEAVALVIGLRLATRLAMSRVEDFALNALTKIEALLPQRLRERTDAVLTGVTWGGERPGESSRFSLPVLLALSRARRDGIVVTFGYTRADGVAGRRRVEPHHIVALNRRWYLLGWDLERDDWRNFRLDRIEDGSVEAGRTAFGPRELPASSPVEVVLAGVHSSGRRSLELELLVTAEYDDLVSVLGWLRPRIDAVAENEYTITIHDESARILAIALALVAMDERMIVHGFRADDETRHRAGGLVDSLQDLLAQTPVSAS